MFITISRQKEIEREREREKRVESGNYDGLLRLADSGRVASTILMGEGATLLEAEGGGALTGVVSGETMLGPSLGGRGNWYDMADERAASIISLVSGSDVWRCSAASCPEPPPRAAKKKLKPNS